MLDQVIRLIDSRIALLTTSLKSHQNSDGGFKGFYTHDALSGVWSSAEIVHTVGKYAPKEDRDWLARGAQFLAASQNADGGWPFRVPGKSIVDVTAWTCLALSHFGYQDAIRRGIEYLLQSRANTGAPQEEAWGLTAFEQDRVYSTWAAVYCIARLLRTEVALGTGHDVQALSETIGGAADWLKRGQNADGTWGPVPGAPASVTSTSVALHTLFILGLNPKDFVPAANFLVGRVVDDHWESEDEIVVTQEGYELTQEWFTGAMAFRSLIFFAEFQLVPIEVTDALFHRLVDLIEPDGGVRLAPTTTAERVWTIPFMLDALAKYRRFVLGNKKEYTAFLDRKKTKELAVRRKRVEDQLTVGFPYPISSAFFAYKHELDFHRRFHGLIHTYEVAIKYSAIVCLSGYLAGRERVPAIDQHITGRFARPSLGDWCQLLYLLLRDSRGARSLLEPATPDDVCGTRVVSDSEDSRENLVQLLERIVELRNQNSGHGAMRSLFEYKLIVDEQEAGLYRFYERLRFLAEGNSFLVLSTHYDEFGEGDRYRIRVFKGISIQDSELETTSRLAEGQHDTMVRYVYFQNLTNSTIVNLYPFISYTFCDDCKREQFFFYNGRRSATEVQYLSYGCGHVVVRTNAKHIDKRLGLDGMTPAPA